MLFYNLSNWKFLQLIYKVSLNYNIMDISLKRRVKSCLQTANTTLLTSKATVVWGMRSQTVPED